ncbi:molybdopterin-dependent oxidoreductase [Sphingobium tyrosinilyticum]|uniref:Molybdopterin-dependent oxidoreductase n=1 Tax=Sphingobium tyrosinilyticum TaxID=2715436 RepID=A0ABV9EUQ4_9SPHN
MAVVRTLCGQCAVGCGVRAVTGEGREMSFAGDRVHPANGGLLCGQSDALTAMLPLEGRLLHPVLDGQRVTWRRMIGQVARRLKDTLARHGPGSVAMHVTGDLLTEDYYVANKLMKGFIGSAHIDGPCWNEGGMEAAYRAALGEDVVPGTYEDVEQADLILAVGASALLRHPVLAERIAMAREQRGVRLVLLTEGEDVQEEVGADLRLKVEPGSAAVLLNGLLLHAHDCGCLADVFMARHVMTAGDFWTRLRLDHDLWSVARRCGLGHGEVRAFYDLFTPARRVVTLYGPAAEGDDLSLSRAILNLHLAMGWIGAPGAAPTGIARAPNAMGAREVGCDSRQLAAHRDFSADAIAQTARFWGARQMAAATGLAGAALVEAIENGGIRALWLVGGLPPAGHPLRAALAKVPSVILSTAWIEQGIALDHVFALPAPVWIEKDGTITGADRLISRQRRLFPLPGEAKPDWWSLTQVARAMGWHDAFHYERAAEIHREHARLTAYHNEGERLLNLRRHAPISNPAYDELTPWRWGETPFDEGRFPTSDGNARLIL